MPNKVMVISVHPDDETLGCGGTILKHLQKGDDVYCVHVTEGNEHQQKLIKEIEDKININKIKYNLCLSLLVRIIL